MKHLRLIIAAGLLMITSRAHAMWQNTNWFNFDLSYNVIEYEEPGVMTEEGKNPGFRLEGGYALSDVISVAVRSEYIPGFLDYDGSTFSGTPIQQITRDTQQTTGAGVYFNYMPVSFYIGYAQRYWKNDLVISYLRETTYDYMPIAIWYFSDPWYLQFEYRNFLKGENISHMSDVNASRHDVHLKQNSGQGYFIEWGHLFSGGTVKTKLSLFYEKWDIDPSETQSDGVDTLVEPKNNTQRYGVALGLIF